MANYALLDRSNTVINVVVLDDAAAEGWATLLPSGQSIVRVPEYPQVGGSWDGVAFQPPPPIDNTEAQIIAQIDALQAQIDELKARGA